MAKIIISLPDELLYKVDKFSIENDFNRSEFIRYALRKVLSAKSKKDNKKNVEA
jgi:metal-responsive CopG/Arc/MetJ family transcriptional regulator